MMIRERRSTSKLGIGLIRANDIVKTAVRQDWPIEKLPENERDGINRTSSRASLLQDLVGKDLKEVPRDGAPATCSCPHQRRCVVEPTIPKPMFERAMEIGGGETLGPNHRERSLNNLAKLVQNQGDSTGAKPH